MIKKIVFCLILLCCMSSIAFAENPSDNVNETTINDGIDIITPIDDIIYVSPNPEHINDGIDIITPIDDIIYVSPNPEHTHNKTL